MRTIILFTCFALIPAGSGAQDFLRKLPDRRLSNQITAKTFRNNDAVIILKEQSFKVEPGEVNFKGVTFTGLQTTRTSIILVKVLTEAGVARYASFELTYPEYFGDEIPAGFAARARVQKENDDVIELPEEDVKVIVSRETNDGDPLERKVLFKVPNVTTGDIVQIEYGLTMPLSRSNSGIFFYNAADPVLFSNLAITLPAQTGVTHFSLPPDEVGNPTVEQLSNVYGSGKTYFWSLKNLNGIAEEPFGPPFEDQSLLTAFVTHSHFESKIQTSKAWADLAEEFHKEYLDGKNVSEARIKELGFSTAFRPTTIAGVDSLYAALRRSISLLPHSSLYPRSDDIDEIFERKKGDASDLAYILFRILIQRGLNPQCAWIRDKRNGQYDRQIPSTQWFDRIGVLVALEGKERLYAFDRGIPATYELPWHLRGTNMAVIGKAMVEHRTITTGGFSDRGTLGESHVLYLGSSTTVMDSLQFRTTGWRADQLRSDFYELENSEITERIRTMATDAWMKDIRSLKFNNPGDSTAFQLECEGASKATVEVLDTLMVIKPRNLIFRWLHGHLLSPIRRSHILLPERFNMTATWTIKTPVGFELRSTPSNRSLRDVQNVPASIIYTKSPEGVLVKATLRFEAIAFNVELFPAILRVIDTVSQESEREIVFRRLKR
ncbi:MAG: DUF3857 domain-containing protein [Bacteroidota bacterium]